jgi:hypothetical protein
MIYGNRSSASMHFMLRLFFLQNVKQQNGGHANIFF